MDKNPEDAVRYRLQTGGEEHRPNHRLVAPGGQRISPESSGRDNVPEEN